MKEYISRGDFTNDIAFNRYKAVLNEYNNLKELKTKIKHHVEVRAGETVYAVWRRELMEMIS